MDVNYRRKNFKVLMSETIYLTTIFIGGRLIFEMIAIGLKKVCQITTISQSMK